MSPLRGQTLLPVRVVESRTRVVRVPGCQARGCCDARLGQRNRQRRDGTGLDCRCSVRTRVVIGSVPGEGIGRAREDAVEMAVLSAGSAGGDAHHVQIRASVSTRKAYLSRTRRRGAGPGRGPGPVALLYERSRVRMRARGRLSVSLSSG